MYSVDTEYDEAILWGLSLHILSSLFKKLDLPLAATF